MHHPSCSMSHREKSVTATAPLPWPRPNPTINHAQTDWKADDTEQNVVIPPLLPGLGGRVGLSENDPLHSKKPPSGVTSALAAETLQVATSPAAAAGARARATRRLNQLSFSAKAKPRPSWGGRKLLDAVLKGPSRALARTLSPCARPLSNKGRRGSSQEVAGRRGRRPCG